MGRPGDSCAKEQRFDAVSEERGEVRFAERREGSSGGKRRHREGNCSIGGGKSFA